MADTSLNVQAIIYNNDFDALYRSCESIANAVEIAQMQKQIFAQVTFAYGDASSEPALSEEQVLSLRDLFAPAGNLTYTFFNENTGFGKGHNLLASNTDADWLLIINPDIVVGPSFFPHMLEPLEEAEKVGIVEARQTPVEHPKVYDQATGETSWASGACMLADAKLYQRIGGFDAKTFYMYCEDVDYSWRVRLEGYKIIYQPAAPAYHPKRLAADAGRAPSQGEILNSSLSNMLMAYKWSDDERLEALKHLCSTSDEPGWADSRHDALEAFEKLEKEGPLPKRLDPEHTVTTFDEIHYHSPHRYLL